MLATDIDVETSWIADASGAPGSVTRFALELCSLSAPFILSISHHSLRRSCAATGIAYQLHMIIFSILSVTRREPRCNAAVSFDQVIRVVQVIRTKYLSTSPHYKSRVGFLLIPGQVREKGNELNLQEGRTSCVWRLIGD